MKISIVGLGYVGLANALLLEQKNMVVAYDIVHEKIEQLKKGVSCIVDEDIERRFASGPCNITFTDKFDDILGAELYIIATPTDYDIERKYFNTSSIEKVIEQVIFTEPDAIILIKSTIPMGYVKGLRKKYKTDNIIFSPEFLREGKALYDNLYPDRIVIGEKSERGKKLAEIYLNATVEKTATVIITDPTEAEAIKLFSNTYLANRVAFFNELDTYAICEGLDSKDIIDGVCLDLRIGDYYNNPSFGYGGYCLDKDTKQLLANYANIPNNLMVAIVASNETRKKFIAKQVIATCSETIGIYRLIMKSGSNNFRSSSVIGVIEILKSYGKEVIIFEPTIEKYGDYKIVNDFDEFTSKADLIIANRMDEKLKEVKDKVWTRDLYYRN